MFAMLLVAVSLLTQAYIFRDVENWESNVEVDMLDRYREKALAGDEADRWSAESDSSRDEGMKAGR